MTIRVVKFSNGGTKCLPKNQHTERKLLNFDNWANGQLSIIGQNRERKLTFESQILALSDTSPLNQFSKFKMNISFEYVDS